jgi:hypothetical protein
VFNRSQLQWFDKEPENGGTLHGSLDLRTVDTLRSSDIAGAPESAVDIVLKGSDRAYTFVPRVYPWLYLIASAVPQSAVATSLASYRDAQLVVNLMRECVTLYVMSCGCGCGCECARACACACACESHVHE